MNRSIICFFCVYTAFILSGCGGGGGSSTTKQPTGPINLLSPKDGQTVRFSHVTFEVDIKKLTNIKAKNNSIENSNEITGITNSTTSYLYRIPLIEGKNDIEVSAKNNEGEDVSIAVMLISENAGYAPITLDIDNSEGYGEVDTKIATKPFDKAKEYLIDKDGDGVIDDSNISGTFALRYNATGRYTPIMTVRTSDNILYTDSRNLTTSISVKAMPLVSDVNAIEGTIVDLESDGDYIYALASTRIYKISMQDISNIQPFELSGLSNPQGFTLDLEGNLFIADTDNNRILKLLKSSDFGPDLAISGDGSFGSLGDGNGELDSPRDVSVYGSGLNQKIYALDSGNNRVQVFDANGEYLSQFDGSTTPGGKLNNPLNMIGAPNVVITDTGNKLIRGLSVAVDGNEREDFSITLQDDEEFQKVTHAYGSMLVSESNSRQLKFMYEDSGIDKSLALQKIPFVALSYNDDRNIMFASKGGSGLYKVEIALDPPGLDPESLVKKFIQAFIDEDYKLMLDLSDGHPQYIALLADNRDKALQVFNNLTRYDEVINGESSSVTAYFSINNTESSVNFDLDRINGQWVITGVI